MRIPHWTSFLTGAAVLLLSTFGTADPGADLKSKDFKKRLGAVAAIHAKGGADAEKLLLSALKDRDWEVVERAVEALAERGGEKALKPLIAVAAEGPVRRIRLAAAAALARLGPEEAAKRLSRRLVRKGKGAVHAAEALGVLARLSEAPETDRLRKAVAKAMKSKVATVRAATAGALRVFPAEERVGRFERLLDDEHIAVVAAALDALRETPTPTYLSAVAAQLVDPDLNDVVARRAIAAIVAIFSGLEPEESDGALKTLEALIRDASKEAIPAARAARLVGLLGASPPPPEEDDEPSKGAAADVEKNGKKAAEKDAPGAAVPAAAAKATLPSDVCLGLLEPLLWLKFEGVRAAAVRALRRIRTPKAIERAAALLVDANARVRFQMLHALVAGRGLDDAPTLEQVIDRLANDPAPSVREEAAVLLGRSGPKGAPFEAPVRALAEALEDKSWSVAVVAAVSLGKTRAEAAVEPLAAKLNRKAVKDWRLRGAAVVGLGKVQRKSAVPHLIRALKDRDEWVRRNAFEFLRRLTKRKIVDDPVEWSAWWKRNGPTYTFEDRKAAARLLKKGGYATKPVDVYDKGRAALDVVVLQSRGDHIERLLDDLRIAYRITRAAQVHESDLHMFAIFVSNCTGEIQKGDIERLRWFVRVGGYLFCSCWALENTVEPVYPGLVQRFMTKGAVLDNVMAAPCPGDSPFLTDVFRPWTRPIYVLYGSYLIEVLQPERVEVLIDSPVAAARWGGGNLACWFPAGHGVILDSANHFDLQGLERVTGLKTAEDRMGYAMDHMGLDYAELRRLAAGKVWARQADAVKLVRDLSAFRFITNFARLKRRTDP